MAQDKYYLPDYPPQPSEIAIIPPYNIPSNYFTGGVRPAQLEPSPNLGDITGELPIRPTYPITDTLQNQYHGENVLERLRTLLTNVPSKSQYPVSKKSKIIGGVAGALTGAASGPEAGVGVREHITEEPYREAYQDWANRVGALESGLNVEAALNRSQFAGLGGYAQLLNAQTRRDPELTRQLAEAKDPKIINFEYYEKLSPQEKEDFLNSVARRFGIERLSPGAPIPPQVAQFMQNNYGHVYRDRATGLPIDANTIPTGFELIPSTGGDANNPRYEMVAQGTVNYSGGGYNARVYKQQPDVPVIAAPSRIPTVTETKGFDPITGKPITVPIQRTPITSYPFAQVPQPTTPGPTVRPPGQMQQAPQAPNIPIPGQPPSLTPPPPISQAPITQAPITTQTPTAQSPAQIPGPVRTGAGALQSRPLQGVSQETINAQNRIIIPASAAVYQLIGARDEPDFNSYMSFAHLADDTHAQTYVPQVLQLILQGVDKLAGADKEGLVERIISAAPSAIAGVADWISYVTGAPGTGSALLASERASLIQKATANLTPEEDAFVTRILATIGDMTGFRTILGQPSYEWAIRASQNELPIPGKTNVRDKAGFYRKLGAVMGSVNRSLKASRIPLEYIEGSDWWTEKGKELNRLGAVVRVPGQDITPPSPSPAPNAPAPAAPGAPQQPNRRFPVRKLP